MKIIHTADLHLDSPLIGVTQPAERRHELLLALDGLAERARNSGVSAIIVAGDLFDEANVSNQTVHSVADIGKDSSFDWFILRGNHGGSSPYELLGKLCPKIHFFNDDWTEYSFGNVTICGRELDDDSNKWQQLRLDPSRYNILVLHGDVDDPRYGYIDKSAIASSGAKYVALGHRHSFAEHRFGKVRACYSGVLEPRGFDESEQTGYVEIDTECDSIKFVPCAIRSVITKRVDVSGITSDIALERRVQDSVADVAPRNYLNFIFYGEADSGIHIQMVAQHTLKDKFFALRVSDETRAKVDVSALCNEVSLRGEFVKLAMQIEDERLRNDVLKMGLACLSGEEPV